MATTLLGKETAQPHIRAVIHNLHCCFAQDLKLVRDHRAAEFAPVAETGHSPVIAQFLLGVVDLALRRSEHTRAARLLGVAARVLGLVDRCNPDVTWVEQAVRDRLGAAFDVEASAGAAVPWEELVAQTLR